MYRFVLSRLAALVPTLAGISLLVFLMLYLVPGDPAQIMLGERANAESLAELRAAMGLDQPFHVQFYRFFTGLLHGDLGRSIRTHEKITTELFQRFPATCELTIASMFMALVVGIAAGLWAAVRKGKLSDLLSMILATAGISMPVFWLALMLMLLLAVYIPLFPVSGRLSTHIYFEPVTYFYTLDALLQGNFRAFGDILWHLFLPALTLGTIPMAVIARMTRASLLEVLGEDYIRTAWAKGLSQRIVILRHAIKNAFIPTLTVIALQFGYLLGGAIITETIFAWPGIGQAIYLAIVDRDYPLIQAGVFVLGFIVVITNLLVDLLYRALNPRVSLM